VEEALAHGQIFRLRPNQSYALIGGTTSLHLPASQYSLYFPGLTHFPLWSSTLLSAVCCDLQANPIGPGRVLQDQTN